MTEDRICIAYNNNQQFFCLREGLSSELFVSLLKQIFSLEGSPIALQSQRSGVIYDIAEFCHSQNIRHSNDIFSMIVSTASSNPQGSNNTSPRYGFASPGNNNNNNNNYLNQAGRASSLSRSLQKSSQMKSLQKSSRTKSTDFHIPKGSQRQSIKSASKHSEEPCQFLVEDYEVFMTTNKDLQDELYCFLLFDEAKMMKLYGATACRAYQQQFPFVDFYYSLYPSKRSRGPFQPSDNAYLFSFFQGHSMIFEREVAISGEVSEDIVRALAQYVQKHDLSHSQHSKSERRMFNFNEENTYTENSFSMINQFGSELNFPKKDGSFSDLVSQDRVFELIECFSVGQIRHHFNDDEFKELLRLIRKNHKKLNMLYEQFKVDNDHDELANSIRHIMHLPQSTVKTNNVLQQQFKPLQESNGNSKSTNANNNNNNTNENKEKKKLFVNEMSFDVSSKQKRADLRDIKQLKTYLKAHNGKFNKETSLTNAEIGYLVYSVKNNDHEASELLSSLSQYSYPKVVMNVLKAFSSGKMAVLLESHFTAAQIECIASQEQTNYTPIHAAFLNWMVLGNLNDLLLILKENLPSHLRRPSILKKKKISQDIFNGTESNNPSPRKEPHFEIPDSNEGSNRSGNDEDQDDDDDGDDDDDDDDDSGPESPLGDIAEEFKLQFKYSEYAERQKRNRRPTFTLHSRQKDEDYNDTLEESLVKNQEYLAIRGYLEMYFQESTSQKDSKYREIFSNLLGEQYIQESMLRTLEEVYAYNYPPFYGFLSSFTQSSQFEAAQQLEEILKKFSSLKSKISHILDLRSPICEEKLLKYKGFHTYISFQFYQELNLTEREYRMLNRLFLWQDLSVIGAYELFSQNLDTAEFMESLKVIEKVKFFKRGTEFGELDQLDRDSELSNLVLYIIRSTQLTSQNMQVIEKSVRLGDRELLKIFRIFQERKDSDQTTFIKQLMHFAEQREQDVAQLEKKLSKDSQGEIQKKSVDLQLDTLNTFKSLFKNVEHLQLIEQLVQKQHVLTQSAFQVFDFTKDKQDIVETITLIYKWNYPIALRNNIKQLFFDAPNAREKVTLEGKYLRFCSDSR